MKKMVLYGYYLTFSLVILIHGLRNPYHNWDLIGYIASAKYYTMQDKEALHIWTYNELKKCVSPDRFQELTSGAYREALHTDPEAFAENLPYYQSRCLYVLLVFLATKLGINACVSTYLVSALAVSLGLWVFFLSFRPYTDNLLLLMIPVIGLTIGLQDMARASTPDGLAFLTMGLAVWFLLRGKRLILVLLPLWVVVRTDMIFLALIVLVYLFFIARGKRKLVVLTSIAAAIAAFLGLNLYFGVQGWKQAFHFAFVQYTPYILTTPVEINTMEYLRVLEGGIRKALWNKTFAIFVLISGLVAFLMTRRPEPSPNPIRRDMFFLITSSWAYLCIHFVIFPDIHERFFFGQYLVAGCVLLWAISQMTRTKTF